MADSIERFGSVMDDAAVCNIIKNGKYGLNIKIGKKKPLRSKKPIEQ